MAKKRKTFGQILHAACEKHGVSHRELSRRLGVNQSRIPEIMRGENMTEKLLKRCAKALGLDADLRLVKRRTK